MKHVKKSEFSPDPQRLELPSDFWAQVDRTDFFGCWIWTGSLSEDQYGKFVLNGKQTFVHRLSHEAHNGAIPQDREIGHTCHNPACVQPLHLEAITHQENQRQMGERRRGKPTRVLTVAIVTAARLMCAAGRKIVEIARELGYRADTIRKAIRGINWPKLETPPVPVGA